jgi:hypothetical protein
MNMAYYDLRYRSFLEFRRGGKVTADSHQAALYVKGDNPSGLADDEAHKPI